MNAPLSRRNFVKGLSLLSLAPLVYRGAQGIAQASEQASTQRAETLPNVLIVVFDTLSAPHMSLYGYPRQTTPNLARFAERATVYHRHYAAANFTTPGTASLLTGTYPWLHRAFNHAGTVTTDYEHHNLFSAFANGPYTSIAYTHNLLANSFLYKFGKDIDVHMDPSEFCLGNGSFADRIFPRDADIAARSFDDLILRRGGETPSSLFLSLADRVRMRIDKQYATQQYLREYPRGVPELFKLFFVLEHAIDGMIATINAAPQPFLTYFHLLPPHEPYTPRREFIGLFDDNRKEAAKEARFFSQGQPEAELNRLRRHYDEHIAYADAEFGRLLDYLEQSGRLDDTIVVFTSDHGQLFERGIHGHVTQTLYDPVIHVPLLISLPGQQQREDVHSLTSCVDLLPTLLYLTGQPIPEWTEGSVLPNFSPQATANDRSIFAIEAKSNPKLAPLAKATFSLHKGEYKLLGYLGYKTNEEFELYNLANDPEEREDLFLSQRSVAAELRNELTTYLQGVNQPYLHQ
jgi:arylsulfatase A-like enzyme